MRKLLQILLIALLVTSLTLPALADETYPSYTYNEWDDSVATPAGYTVARTIYSNMVQGGPWKTASRAILTLLRRMKPTRPIRSWL